MADLVYGGIDLVFLIFFYGLGLGFLGLVIGLPIATLVVPAVDPLRAWARSVRSSAGRVASGSSEDAMAAMNRALAIGEIAALAVLADGETTEREREALSGALRAAGFDVSVDEAVARAARRHEDVTGPAVLRAAVARAAALLGAEEGAQALAIVKTLAGSGSTLGAAEARFDAAEGGYRGVRRAKPPELVGLVAAALGIPAPP